MIEIRPIVQATGPDNPARQISVTNWNIGHALTAAPDSLIGTDGTGAELEYPVAYFATAEALEVYVTDAELTTALANYSLVGHTHPISDVDGLQEALDAIAAPDLSEYATDAELAAGLATKAPLVHTHVIADVTGLQGALDGKVDDSELGAYATDAELAAGLATKQPVGSYSLVGHTHVIADTTGLQAALDAKVDDSEMAAMATDAELAAGLATKANVAHTHVIADTTGLQAALDGKADDGDLAALMPKTGGTFSGDIIVPAEAYGVAWNGSNEAPTKNDVYDKIETVTAGGGGVTSFNTRSGAVTLTAADVTAALPAFTGDVTSPAGSPVNTIGAGKVTLAMQASMATASVVYRKTAGSGAPEVQTLATLKTDLGLTGTNSGDQTTITGNAGTATALATSRDFSIAGAGITAAAVAFNGTANVVLAGSVDAGHITLARMANMATASLIYRKTAGAGVPEVQTLATLKSDLLLTGTNSGDQSSIVGITGTIAQFNTACTDADFATTAMISDTAYAVGWNGVTTIAPSQNAVYDKIAAMDTTIAAKADTSALANYLPLTGGTLSGALTVNGNVAATGNTHSFGPTGGAATDLLTYYYSTNYYQFHDYLIAAGGAMTTRARMIITTAGFQHRADSYSFYNLAAGTLYATLDATGLTVTGAIVTQGASAGVNITARDSGNNFILSVNTSGILTFYSAGGVRATLTDAGAFAATTIAANGPAATISINANKDATTNTTARNPGLLIYNGGGSAQYGVELGYAGGAYATRLFAQSGTKLTVGFLGGAGTAQSDFVDIGTFSATGLHIVGDLTTTGSASLLADENLMADIRPIRNALRLVNRLRGVRYREGGRQRIGVVGQEVREVLPRLVSEDADGIVAVDYGRLTAVLIEAVKTLTERVEQLEAA